MEQQPQSQSEPLPEGVELHRRSSCGIEVVLWWVEGTMDTYVTVEDGDEHGSGNFRFAVPSPDKALHCFYHAMVFSPLAGKNKQRNLYNGVEADA